MKLIYHGRLYTMEAMPDNPMGIIEDGYLITDGAVIKEIGSMNHFSYSMDDFTEHFHAAGNLVLPGLIDAHSHIGLFEDGTGPEGEDGNEDSDPCTPHLRAIDAINPMDRAFTEGLQAGVTTSVTGPGSANVLGGSFAAIKMYGDCVDDMIIKAPAAQKAALGENPKTVYHGKNETPVTRMATAAILREMLFKAKEYENKLIQSQQEEEDKPEWDMKCEAMLPVLRKEIPLKIHVHRADDMFTAIRIAKEFDIKISLEHCTEGYLVANRLSKETIPVLLGPVMTDRSKIELKNQSLQAGRILEQAGVKPVIITDHPETPVQYLGLSAGLLVKEGLSEEAALKGITIYAAEACGIAGRVGSLQAGKDADIAVFDRLPFDYAAKTLAVFVNGVTIKNELSD